MDAHARSISASSAVWRGRPAPLGATWDGEGVNFALYSEHAQRVELCLFDAKGRHETERVELRERTDFVWHCYLPEARPGQLYGYRVHGTYAPEEGHRFNAHKLLLDPYARMIAGELRWSDAHFGYRAGGRREDLTPDIRDNASGMPKCQVVDCAFTWGKDRRPNVPWQDTLVYELHVKGFTRLNQHVPPHQRGTYAGLASAPAIEHLKRLGVTAVELLPVHAFIDDRRLIGAGLRNYWGYNSIGFFAPDLRYAALGALGEFKTMVETLHSAGIEVILDGVYNHTGEGDHLGPTLAFRGIDNRSYYRLDPENPRYYADCTGTGNTLDAARPIVQQLIMDSLRYWVSEMHVDGFRFDLAAALARGADRTVDLPRSFLNALHHDPVISQVKLIAEPWDLGEDGYQLGNFPPGWAEWNGKYRDAVRSYWRGDGGVLGELASRLSGSSDLYERTGRGPGASLNFVTAHDGFTLHDLVSYNEKHNEANREDNRDGESHNRSWNCGVEGPTDDPAITSLRERQKRNLLATLFLSQGVPMLLAGDEMGRSQRGNNNAYCQDNETSWLAWERAPASEQLLEFVRRVSALRGAHPLLRRRGFFRGRAAKDLIWLNPSGVDMSDQDWRQPYARCLGALLSGAGVAERDERGRAVQDDDLLVLMNAHDEEIAFTIPGDARAGWETLVDTSTGDGAPARIAFGSGESYPLQGRSLALLRSPRKR
jgi:isoamylase